MLLVPARPGCTPRRGAGAFRPPHAHPAPPQLLAARFGPGPQSPHLSNGQRTLEELAAAAGDTRSVLPLSPAPFFRLPLGHDSSAHLGACATLWLLSPPLRPLWGAPSCPEPPNTPHIPLVAQLSGQSPRTSPGRGTGLCLPGPPKDLGTPAPKAEQEQQPHPARTHTPPASSGPAWQGTPGLVWPDPRPPWRQGRGPGADTEAFVWPLRQALHFPGRLSLRPGLFPADHTSCSAPPSVPPACGGRGGAQMWLLGAGDGGEARPHLRLSHGRPQRSPYGGFHPLPPSAVWPRAPGSKWADGLRIRLASALLTPF